MVELICNPHPFAVSLSSFTFCVAHSIAHSSFNFRRRARPFWSVVLVTQTASRKDDNQECRHPKANREANVPAQQTIVGHLRSSRKQWPEDPVGKRVHRSVREDGNEYAALRVVKHIKLASQWGQFVRENFRSWLHRLVRPSAAACTLCRRAAGAKRTG